MYDIALISKDVKVQPNGLIKVSIELSDEQIEKYKEFEMFIITDGKNQVELETTLESNILKFETKQLSLFGIVGVEKLDVQPTVRPTTESDAVDTADNSNLSLLAFTTFGALLAAIIAIIIIKKNKIKA